MWERNLQFWVVHLDSKPDSSVNILTIVIMVLWIDFVFLFLFFF